MSVILQRVLLGKTAVINIVWLMSSFSFCISQPFNRPPMPSKSTAAEESTVPGSYSVSSAAAVAAALNAGVRPLSAPDEQLASGGWASPLKAERTCVRSAISPNLPPLPEVPVSVLLCPSLFLLPFIRSNPCEKAELADEQTV